MLNYWPDKEPIYALYRDAKARGEMMIEASRLALDPSIDSLAVVNFVFQATVASAMANGVTAGITVINSNRKRFYSRYGFYPNDTVSDRFIETAQSEGSVLEWSFDKTAVSVQKQITRLQGEYARDGRVRLDANHKQEESR